MPVVFLVSTKDASQSAQVVSRCWWMCASNWTVSLKRRMSPWKSAFRQSGFSLVSLTKVPFREQRSVMMYCCSCWSYVISACIWDIVESGIVIAQFWCCPILPPMQLISRRLPISSWSADWTIRRTGATLLIDKRLKRFATGRSSSADLRSTAFDSIMWLRDFGSGETEPSRDFDYFALLLRTRTNRFNIIVGRRLVYSFGVFTFIWLLLIIESVEKLVLFGSRIVAIIALICRIVKSRTFLYGKNK